MSDPAPNVRNVTFQRTYDDEALAEAVATSHSWRGVLRALGLKATSAGASRTARRYADQLGLDYSHFTGQRRWSDAALTKAVSECRSWREVTTALGIAGGSSYPLLRGHALRLGLDTSHFGPPARPDAEWTLAPSERHLRYAGSLIAAAWFALCGYEVSWPLEPYSYDLIARSGDRVQRVQVKTTTHRKRNVWNVDLSPGGKDTVYDPDDIDSFFIIDAEFRFYFIPFSAVGGFRGINLSAYTQYIVFDPTSLNDALPVASGS